MTQTTKRSGRCSGCRNLEEDMATGKAETLRVYGDACGNCGFYSPITSEEAEGICCKFELLARRHGMGIYHRRLGDIREGGTPLIVGGAFYCGEFRPIHDVPDTNDPAIHFWAPEERSAGHDV